MFRVIFRGVLKTLEKEERIEQFSSESIFRLVVFHHHLDCAKPTDEKNLLKYPDEVIAYLEKSKVDMVLGGHIHDPLARLSNSRYPNSKRHFPIVLAGTALSSRTRSDAPNSFNLIDLQIKSSGIDAQVIRYDLTQQETFLPLTQMHFERKGRDSWSVHAG